VSNANAGHLITLTKATIPAKGDRSATPTPFSGAKQITDRSGNMTLFYCDS